MADAEQELAGWKKAVGYVGFSVLAFFVFLYLTFPYEVAEQRLVTEAQRQGYVLTVGSLGPGLFGVTAKNLELGRPAAPGAEHPPAPLPIDSFAIRPALFPPGIAFVGSVLGGKVSGSVGGISDVSVRLHAKGVSLGDPRLKLASGVDLEGEANLTVEFDIPRVVLGAQSKNKEPDLGQANGKVELVFDSVKINGGTVSLALPGFGNEPAPIDLPKIALGDGKAELTFNKGQGTVDALSLKSEDLELLGTGTVRLAKNVGYSEPQLELKLKTEDEFRRRLGLIGSAFSMLPTDPSNPSFRVAKIGGYLSHPALRTH